MRDRLGLLVGAARYDLELLFDADRSTVDARQVAQASEIGVAQEMTGIDRRVVWTEEPARGGHALHLEGGYAPGCHRLLQLDGDRTNAEICHERAIGFDRRRHRGHRAIGSELGDTLASRISEAPVALALEVAFVAFDRVGMADDAPHRLVDQPIGRRHAELAGILGSLGQRFVETTNARLSNGTNEELILQRARHPRHLKTFGLLAHRRAHPAKHQVDLEPWRVHVLEQCVRIRAVVGVAVECHIARTGGVADDRLGARRLQRGETAGRADDDVGVRRSRGEELVDLGELVDERHGVGHVEKGVVATGIEDEHVDPRLAHPHECGDLVRIDAVVAQVDGVLDPGVDRQQVVGAAALHAVAGIVEDRIGASCQALGEGGEPGQHLFVIGIDQLDRLEAGLPEQGRHIPRIVDRVVERWQMSVSTIADDQCYTVTFI